MESAKYRLERIFSHFVQQRYANISPCSSEKNIIRSPYPDVYIPDNVSVYHLFLEGCLKHPHNLAVVNVENGCSYTYQELLTSVKKFGSALVRRGFSKGDILATIAPNCIEYIICFFATVAIGGAVATINPVYTENEIFYHLQDVKPRWIVTTAEVLKNVFAATAKTAIKEEIIIIGGKPCKKSLSFAMFLEDDGSAFPDSLQINVHNDLAVVPYSSGTTGKPKGVMLTHYNVVANLYQKSDFIGPPDNRYIFFLPLFHIYGIAVMLRVFYTGACIYLLSKFEPEIFLRAVEKYKITNAPLVPPIVNFLVKSPLTKMYDLSSLRVALCGAAPLGKEVIEELLRKIPTLENLQQGYGMTEAGPAVISTQGMQKQIPSTIGYVIPNTEVKVVDLKTRVALGPNQEGELCIRGPQVMKGYLNNPKATKEIISPDGFLHTGDICYYTQEGLFYIVDRVKELIKVNAYQVAPAELEAVLMSHPGIEDAAVIGIPNERTGEVPKAFVVKKDKTLTEERISIYMKKNVAPFKLLRGGVEFVTEIPKSASGKILRRRLRDAEMSKIRERKITRIT